MKTNFFSGRYFLLLAFLTVASISACRKTGKETPLNEATTTNATKSNAKVSMVGSTGMHDPSTIVKRNGVYHVWGTGNQVYHLTSTDLINWTVGSTVFAAGTYPAWTTQTVPGFTGHFWAPECVFMNNRYYMYYSVSIGGSNSAIGVATSTDLQSWTDQGVVISSNPSSIYGSIDPAVFADASGRWWMVFGSHATGIWVTEINPATGKRLNTSVTQIAGNNSYVEHEAAYILRNGSYYYLFYNVGTCCAGTSSTYNVRMGRSTSPTGPYVDVNGVGLLNGGGSPVLGASGKYVGPGHIGVYQEGGFNFTTYHYYDANNGGSPTLGIANMGWANGWPFITRDWIPAGRFRIINQQSGKAWDAWGCTGAQGQAIAQGTNTPGLICQQWDFVPLGNGEYRIKAAQGGLSADVINCNANNGALLNLWAWNGLNCQKYRIEKSGNGSLVFTSLTGNRVVEVPGGSTTNGVQLDLWDYNGANWQKWQIAAP